MQRWIIHIDMDAFFASVEQRDHPEYQGKPVIVGGLGTRGVVSTASYEARVFGVHSAMPMSEARRLCPQGIVVPGDHEKYARVSERIRTIFDRFSPLVEPISLDEAFLDVAGMTGLYAGPIDIAMKIKEAIKKEENLTASAGVAPNKFLAKIASDLKKPDGLVIVRPGEEAEFLKDLPVSRLWGAGKVTVQHLYALGIQTIGQLAKADVKLLTKKLGKAGQDLFSLAQGQDQREVVAEADPKSVGREVTFDKDIKTREDIETQLLALSEKVGWRLRRMGCSGRTVTLKIRFASFVTITRSKTLIEPTSLDNTIFSTARELWQKVNMWEGIRLIGIYVSHFQLEDHQLSLFPGQEEKALLMMRTVDKLKEKFGEGVVTRGRLVKSQKETDDPGDPQ